MRLWLIITHISMIPNFISLLRAFPTGSAKYIFCQIRGYCSKKNHKIWAPTGRAKYILGLQIATITCKNTCYCSNLYKFLIISLFGLFAPLFFFSSFFSALLSLSVCPRLSLLCSLSALSLSLSQRLFLNPDRWILGLKLVGLCCQWICVAGGQLVLGCGRPILAIGTDFGRGWVVVLDYLIWFVVMLWVGFGLGFPTRFGYGCLWWLSWVGFRLGFPTRFSYGCLWWLPWVVAMSGFWLMVAVGWEGVRLRRGVREGDWEERDKWFYLFFKL